MYSKVVPTGARLRLICASCGLAETRNVLRVWLAPEMCASGGLDEGPARVGRSADRGESGSGPGPVLGGRGLGGVDAVRARRPSVLPWKLLSPS